LKALLLATLFLFFGCLEKKQPEAENDSGELGGSQYTSIEGTTDIVADGSATSTITLVDSSETPVVGLVPGFAASGSGNSYGGCTETNQDGVAICSMTSTKAETKTLRITSPEVISGDEVTFIAGTEAQVGFSVQPSSSALVGANFATQPVAQVQDAFGNAVVDTVETITLAAYTDLDCTVAAPGILSVDSNPMNTDGSTGIVSFSGVQYSKWETLYLGISAPGLNSSCSNAISITQTIDTGASSITATPTTADGASNSTVTIQLIDTLAAPIVGAVPTFSATDTGSTNVYTACSATDGTGTSTCTMTSTKAETKTLSVITPVPFSDGTVVFSAGAVSAANSIISGTSNHVADGAETSDITITLLDAFNNGVSGSTPTFSATDTGGRNVYNACSASNASGVSTCSMTSTKAETKTLSLDTPVSVAGNDIVFINGALNSLTFTTQPSANGVTGFALDTQPVVEARDANNNLITASNINITLAPYTNVGCTSASAGTLSATTNPVTTTAGVSTFAGVQHDTAETLYIRAESGGVTACSNAITIIQRPEVSYSVATLNENAFNIGTITETLVLTLSNDTFTGANGNDFIALGRIVSTNLPSGFTAVANRDSATQITITLTGSADDHEDADDISNLTFTFQDSAFTLGDASVVTNFAKSDIAINFLDAYTLTYSASTLNENVSNTGAISETLTLTLAGTTLTGSDSDDFVGAGKVTVGNLPGGLTAVMTRDSSTQLTFSISNTATNHADANDISNLTFTFQDSAFASGAAAGVTDYNKSDIVIDFLDPASLAFDVNEFTEAASNTGAIGNDIVVTLTNDTFDTDLTGDVTISNVPSGLTASYTRDSGTQVTISLTGDADNHADVDDVANVTVDFAAAAFTNNTVASNVVNNGKNDILINYSDPASLSYSFASFNERINNDGGIDETTIVTITNDTFVADISGTITATNVPAGLTANFTKVSGSDTQILVNFSGNATAHASANDVANVTFTFSAGAFTGNTVASNVINYAKNDFAISFTDPPELTYASSTFTESTANDGSIDDTIVITLAGDLFAADITGDITPTNLPPGLSANFNRDSDTQITVSLTSNATNHADANDVSNLTFTFADAAFQYAASASAVTNYAKNDLVVDFEDPASIAYSVGTVNEAASNTGAITETIVMTLTGDTFEADLTGDIIASNVPSGLTAVFTRDSDTQVTLSFTGTADNHADANDVGNLTVTFQNNAFVGNTDATNVMDYLKNDIIINYEDPASIAFSTGSITEVAANTGAITDTIVMTLTGDTFDANITGDIVVTNTPSGLTAVVTRDSGTQVTVSFTGTADNHEDVNDISNLTITCAAAAFTNNTDATNVVNYLKNDFVVDFNDTASLAYSTSSISEVAANTGAITDTIVITLTNDTFDADITGDVSATNVPSGLTAVFTRDSGTQITLSFTGTADNHENVNDISNLTVTFAAAAFSNNTDATNVTNYLKNDISIDFDDAASLAYSTSNLSEASSNTGAITDTVVITLTNDTFDADITGDVSATNVPSGLTAVFTRDSATQVTLSFTGTADNHEDANDIANLTVTFAAAAFTNNTDATNVANYLKNDIAVDFADAASLAYSSSNLTEVTANTGAITDTIVMTLTNDTFEADLTGDITATNVPSGLTAVFTRDSATQVTLSFTGTADNHANANDIGNLTVTFSSNAFVNNTDATNVTNYIKNDITVDFADPASLSYNVATVSEVTANTGAVTETFVITLSNDTFEADLTGDITATNVPSGLTAVFTRDSATQVTLSFTGTADSHANGDDISNLTVIFAAAAFVNNIDATNVTNYSRNDLAMDFDDPAAIAYGAASVSEVVANTGAITDTIVMTLSGDTFDADLTGDITATNVPSGLTAVFTRNSGTQVTLSFTGTADNHENADDISNLTVTFANAAFVNNTDATNVTNYLRNDLSIDYADAASLSFNSSTLTEVTANTGAITDTIVITLTGDTFEADLTGDVSATNVPSGLSAVFTRNSATQVTLSFTGTADNHENANDISNLTVTFAAAAFTNNTDATNVTNYLKNDIVVDFTDAASLSYSAGTVSEALSNVGAITDTFVITLTGDTFPADLTGDFTITNVPSGLTGSLTRDSATQVTVSFSGQADNHANANDVGNVTVTFLDNAFTNNTSASNVTDYLRNDLSIDYKDPDSLSYSAGGVNEDVANDGSITETLVITLNGGDTFAADINGYITATNVPSGLNAVFTRDSDNQVTMSFTGNADNHAVIDDIANLTVEFLDAAFAGNAAAANVTNYLVSNLTISYANPFLLTYSSSLFSEELTRTYDVNTVANYRMNGSVGSILGLDSSDNQLDLTAVSSGTAEHTNSESQFGFLSYGTVDAYLESSEATEFTLNSNFTLEGWVYFVTDHLDTATNHGIFSLDKDVNNRFQVIAKSDGSIGLESDTGEVLSASTGIITEDTWHHVALVVNGTGAGSWKVYVDGSEEVSSDLGSDWGNTAHTLRLGVDMGDNANRIEGYFDEVRVSDNARYTSNFTTPSSEFGTDEYIGNIDNSVTITLTNATFTGVNNDDFVVDSKVTVTNVPDGLTAKMTRTSDTEIVFTLEGTATNNHFTDDDISNLTIEFQNSAFNGVQASQVNDYLKNDFSVDFKYEP
jgi:hypothetical protein